MIKIASRLAMGVALFASAMSAHAIGPSKALVVDAKIQERAGPMPRCPSQFGGTITGTADSALLGPVVLIATDCITPAGQLFNFSQGRMIIMTLSGEQIYADYSGQFVPTGVGAAYVFNGATFQITGGTGKYWRATGGGNLTGGEDMVTGVGTATMTGNIRFLPW